MSSTFFPTSLSKTKYFSPAIICILFGTILFAYVFARALLVSITHDEAFSFNNIVGHSFMEIVSYNTSPGPGTPNNHILNSLLMKLFSWMFGPSAFVLRLPNVLAYFFFLLFSFLICKRLKNSFLIVAGFVLLNIDPYLLDFFGLARGYGIANALLAGTVYFLLECKEKMKTKHLAFTFGCAFFAVLANFSLLHFYIGLLLTVNFIFFFDQQKNSVGFSDRLKDLVKKNTLPFISSIALGAIIFEPLRKILKWHETFGGTDGFWADTAKGEINSFWYGQSYQPKLDSLLNVIVISLSVLILIGAIKSILKKEFSSNAIISFLLLIFPFALHILEHAFFGTEFLISRPGQYLVPLFFIAFLFSAEYLLPKISPAVVCILASLGIVHLSFAQNLSRTSEWPYDCDNKNALHYLDSIIPQNTKQPVTVGVTWIFEPGMNFYQATYHMDRISPFSRENLEEKEYDIYYVLYSDTTMLKNKGKIIIKKFPVSNSYIMK